MDWRQENQRASRKASRVQIELAECIETKTVTTTTLTKRSYPPILLREPPKSLDDFSARDYPLANKPTPAGISDFSYEVDGRIITFREDGMDKVRRLLPLRGSFKPVHY